MPEAECELCKEVITQPICMACLEEEMEEWLRETKPELLDEMRMAADELWMPRRNTTCVLCDLPMDICSYCFTNHMLNWLSSHPMLIREFVAFFNYDLHYNGYGKKLLELV